MQKLIAKYGLAAHLALLAVAPLFLFPFCSEGKIAAVLLWLSLLAAVWTVLDPSMLADERLSEARRRVAGSIYRDPLFWASLTLVVFTGLRAVNTGIALSYDAESSVWHVSDPLMTVLPGVVGSAGDLPFAAAVALLVLLQACRHALGKRARMLFLLLASSLAGLSAVLDLAFLRLGFLDASVLLPVNAGSGCSFAGFAFGLYLIAGTVALVAIFEQRWSGAALLPMLAIGGNVLGSFAFAPLHLSAATVPAALLALAYGLVFARKSFNVTEMLRLVAITLMSLLLGGFLVALLLPEKELAGRMAMVVGGRFFPEGFWEVREALSVVAFKSWVSHLWLGTGVASFPLDFRFNALAADWELLPRGAKTLANGWWLLLAERGVVGFMFFALPFGFLAFTYVRRLIGGLFGEGLPHPACLVAPLVFILFVAAGFFDASSLRADVLLATGALASISAASFSRRKRGQNGR